MKNFAVNSTILYLHKNLKNHLEQPNIAFK